MKQTSPMLVSIQCRIVHDYLERLRSHVQDGYVIRHESRLDNFYMVRLKHMCNGNEIILKADFERLSLTQKTNNLLTFNRIYE